MGSRFYYQYSPGSVWFWCVSAGATPAWTEPYHHSRSRCPSVLACRKAGNGGFQLNPCRLPYSLLMEIIICYRHSECWFVKSTCKLPRTLPRDTTTSPHSDTGKEWELNKASKSHLGSPVSMLLHLTANISLQQRTVCCVLFLPFPKLGNRFWGKIKFIKCQCI